MKLAIVRQKYTPFGGAERFVERALSSLAGRGLDVTVITREWKAPQAPGADGRQVRICNPFYLGRRARDAGFARAVQAIIAAGDYDLVQSHERIPGCHLYRAGDGVHATWMALRRRVQSPLAALFSRLHPWHRYTLAAEAAMFRHPDLRAVICNSQMVKDDIVARFGVAAEKLQVIHNGVDLDHFHPGLRAEHRNRLRAQLDIPVDAPLVLFVGSGFERKGLPQLLQAMVGVPNAWLLVVGKDRRLAAMKRLAARLGIAGRTRFVGAQPDVRPHYAAADAFALPTLYDPFPNAVLEALACGLPVLTSPTSGAAELLDDRFGRVVDALDVAAQTRALHQLLNIPTTQVMPAARAAAASCDLTDMTAQLVALYLQHQARA